MLTPQDLQAIQKVVETAVDRQLEIKLEEKLESKLEEKLESKLEDKLDSKLEEKLDKKLKPLKRDINRIRKDVSYLIKKTDEADVRLERRVTRIENHLGLTA